MTAQERKQLNDIAERLEHLQGIAPSIAVYRQGRITNSLAVEVAKVVDELRAMVGTDEPTTA